MILLALIFLFQEIQSFDGPLGYRWFGHCVSQPSRRCFQSLRSSGSNRGLVDTNLPPSSPYFSKRGRRKGMKPIIPFRDPLVETFLPPYFEQLQKPIFDFGKFENI